MVIYLDSAALVKLIRQEHASADLVAWLGERPGEALVSSALVEVEVPRALRRAAPQALAGVPGVLTRLYRLEIDQTVRATAAAYADPALRSLDAVHLATARLIAGQPGAEPLVFVTYDRRLLKTAEDAGLEVAAPGA
ncbi:type II toxin-antitoxin system VapC family toxin [Streptomyces sp. NRRL F-5135]|uniref:type II toxin-antitoxin system VapC family toxin n=1 Tax=Streptomyces sp. NRRL F-5135 TaxID=1463858 RepID=UPI001F248A45|nr:type II toxin-antitoxin system VapC family toxin [Streptomyces sp. NRRL F-5135]